MSQSDLTVKPFKAIRDVLDLFVVYLADVCHQVCDLQKVSNILKDWTGHKCDVHRPCCR